MPGAVVPPKTCISEGPDVVWSPNRTAHAQDQAAATEDQAGSARSAAGGHVAGESASSEHTRGEAMVFGSESRQLAESVQVMVGCFL